ncbi:MAG: hypothetical protein K5787_13400 [Lentisphaeria bacterium]|nr:hypothetical protein [Lentisphaeria bacterium]
MKKTVVIFICALCAVFCLTSCSQTDAVTEYNDAVELVKRGEYDAALEKATKCVRMNRNDGDAVKLQVLCAFNGMVEDTKAKEIAMQNLKRMLNTKLKDDYEAYYFMGWALFQIDNNIVAFENLKKANEMMPSEKKTLDNRTYANLLYMLGLCCVQNNLAEGREYLAQLEHVKPFSDLPEYYANYAMLSYQLRRYGDANSWFYKAYKIDDLVPQPCLNMAVIYDVIYGNLDQAREYYIRALRRYQIQHDSLYEGRINDRLRAIVKLKKK